MAEDKKRPERESLLQRLAELEEDLGVEAEMLDERAGTALVRAAAQLLREVRGHLEGQEPKA